MNQDLQHSALESNAKKVMLMVLGTDEQTDGQTDRFILVN